MKRVTIYVDEEIWDEVKQCAWNLSSSKARVSAGQYLLGLHLKSFNKSTEPAVNNLVKKVIELKGKKDDDFKSYSKDIQLGKKGK